MREKEPQKPPEHTSEHVKSQNFLGQTPLTQYGPHFLYLPWAPTILSAALGSPGALVHWIVLKRDEIDQQLKDAMSRASRAVAHLIQLGNEVIAQQNSEQQVIIQKVLVNPRRACAARVSVLGLCVCLSVCMSVTQHLTLYVIIRATNDTNLLSGG